MLEPQGRCVIPVVYVGRRVAQASVAYWGTGRLDQNALELESLASFLGVAHTMSSREPGRQLTEEEWIVLLDVYQTHKSERLSPSHPAVLRASETLRLIGQQTARNRGPSFRPPSGLYRQLEAFRRLEPGHGGSDRKVPRFAESVWKRFSRDPKACRVTADAIRGRATGC